MSTSGEGHSMKHTLWMIVGCVLPFLLIFLFPVLGISGGATTLVFFVLMLGCHLMMMGRHGHGGHSGHGRQDDREEQEASKHQH